MGGCWLDDFYSDDLSYLHVKRDLFWIDMEHLLGRALAIIAVPFVLTTIFVATRKGGYYDTDMYKGNGTAH